MPAGSSEIVVDHSFAAPMGRVVSMYADQEFARVRGLSVGASDCDVLVDGGPESAFTVAIRRTLATEGIQPEFKPFIGSTLTVRYSEAWEPPRNGEREATFAIDILGVPAKAAGTVHLLDRGQATDLSLRGTVTAHVPFLASLVTRAIVDSLNDAIGQELQAADTWLSKA